MKHIVLYAMAGWGHMKPLIALIVRIAESREDVVLTYLVDEMHDKVMDELAKLPDQRLKKLENRIHVIDVRGAPPESHLILPSPTGFYTAFEALYLSEPVTCKASGKVFGGLPRPTIAIIDVLTMCVMKIIRSIAPSGDLRVFAWLAVALHSDARQYGPKQLGGHNLWQTMEQEAAETGGDIEEIATRLYRSTTGELIRIPGYPPVYDYEWFPQDLNLKISRRKINAWKFFNDVDGALSFTTPVLEEALTIAMKEYMNGLGKPFFSVGLVDIPIQSSEQLRDGVESQIGTFLAKMEEKFGSGAVIYIAFGSFWWPLEPIKLYALIDQLIANETPFILTRGTSRNLIPEDVSSRITAVEFGIELAWAPQDMILRHPATGWFLGHGGWNSVNESLRYGVPLIVWPISGDQPISAVLLSLVHRVGFELMTVRTGEKGRMKPYSISEQTTWGKFSVEDFRNEVDELLGKLKSEEDFRNEVDELLGKLKSEEGKEVRKNAGRIKQEIAGLWDEGGEARKELEMFLVDYVD